jgi:membrane protease YdiL (CAAX protease family)
MRGSQAVWRDDSTAGRQALWWLLLAAPFYLNDFASIFVKGWHLWLEIDYIAVKLLPLLLIGWLLRSGRMTAAQFGWVRQQPLAFIASFIVAALAGVLIDQNGYQLLDAARGYRRLGGMPVIDNPLVKWIDLTLGLALVALMEEMIFRGALHTMLSRFTASSPAIVAVGAIAFGLIHWSGGLHAVLVTAVIGAVFMAIYLRTRSVQALVLAHFTIDFIAFSGLVPAALFKVL